MRNSFFSSKEKTKQKTNKELCEVDNRLMFVFYQNILGSSIVYTLWSLLSIPFFNSLKCLGSFEESAICERYSLFLKISKKRLYFTLARNPQPSLAADV